MRKVTITVPQDTLTDIVGVLVKRLEEAQSKLKSTEDILNNEQYRRATLENEVRAYKQENKRLFAMLDHEDENWTPNTPTIKESIETNCDDF